jgi:hypothetical protein
MKNKNNETQNDHQTSHAASAINGDGALANKNNGEESLANQTSRDAALLADALLTALKLPGNAATPEFHALAQKLQFANSCSTSADDVTAGFNLRSPENSSATSVPSVPSVSKSSHPADTRLANQLTQKLADLDRRIDDLNDRFLTTLLDNAIAEARILPAERKYWQAQLATDFQTASADLANAKPKLNLVSRTENLPHASPLPSDPQQRSKRIQGIIKAKMTADNLSYDEAWAELKSENPGLFAR